MIEFIKNLFSLLRSQHELFYFDKIVTFFKYLVDKSLFYKQDISFSNIILIFYKFILLDMSFSYKIYLALIDTLHFFIIFFH